MIRNIFGLDPKAIKDEIIDSILLSNHQKANQFINLCYDNYISHNTISSWLSPFNVTLTDKGEIKQP